MSWFSFFYLGSNLAQQLKFFDVIAKVSSLVYYNVAFMPHLSILLYKYAYKTSKNILASTRVMVSDKDKKRVKASAPF